MSAWIPNKQHVDVLVKSALIAAGFSRVPSDGLSWYFPAPGAMFGMGSRRIFPYIRGDREEVTPDELGQMLLAEVVASVAYRYGDKPGDLPGARPPYWAEDVPYTYSDPGFTPTLGEVLKTIDCYEYQACERLEWRDSEARSFCDVLRQAWAKEAEREVYEEAPWGWDPRSVAARAALEGVPIGAQR